MRDIDSDWRVSSFSGSSGGNCVELSWRKSSRSGATGNCVELACDDSVTLIRDTKNRTGGTLKLGETAWRGLLGLTREL